MVGLVLVVGDVRSVRNIAGIRSRHRAGQQLPRRFEVGEAIDLTHWVGIALNTQRQRQGQVRLHLPLVHGIDAETPQGHRYIAGQVIGPAVLAGYAVSEGLQSVAVPRAQTEVRPGVVVDEVVVADIVAAEVAAELKAVMPVRPREVIDELILGDVTSLREIVLGSDDIREVGPTLGAERVYPTELQGLREGAQR